MPHPWLFNPLLHVFLNLQVPYHRATTPRHCRCGCFSLSRLTYFANIDASLVIWPPFHSLFELLDPSFLDGSIFIAASDVLQEIASKSPLSDGSGLKSLTEPLLGWFDVVGTGLWSLLRLMRFLLYPTLYVERLLPVLLQCGLGSLNMDGAMDEVRDFLYCLSFRLMFISFGIESWYCTRIFLVHGQGKSFQFVLIIKFFILIVSHWYRLPKILPARSILYLQVYLMALCSVPSKHFQWTTHLLRLVIFS